MGGSVFQMKACSSQKSATQIMSRATHFRPCLSSSAHSGVKDSQRILLTCLFNFTAPHNSCCYHTYKSRTSSSSVACESGCAFPLCRSDVSCHPSWQRLNLAAHLSADEEARETIYLILLQQIHTYHCCPAAHLQGSVKTFEGFKVSRHSPDAILFMTRPL